MANAAPSLAYRGRLAPTPTGYLHLGHARTFWTAHERAASHGGALILRVEDLDPDRCRPEFTAAMLEDLRWLGLERQEGPDVGGPHAPYEQSQRLDYFQAIWRKIHATGQIYPSPHSRRDVQEALLAPHDEGIRGSGIGARDDDREPIFSPSLRSPAGAGSEAREPGSMNWRFRVSDGRTIVFDDQAVGCVERVAGRDFGDFVVWRKDGFPSYELAVVADDHAMQISEVVRGEDLLTSTARQLLLYEALGWPPPAFYHCPLVRDAAGRRLAKRDAALSLRELRAAGRSAEEVRAMW